MDLSLGIVQDRFPSTENFASNERGLRGSRKPLHRNCSGSEQESLHGSYPSVASLLIYPDPRTYQWSLDGKK